MSKKSVKHTNKPLAGNPPANRAAAATAAAKPARSEARFVFSDVSAKQVSLCGDFNGWATETTPMERAQDGSWETTVALAPGRYQYKFVVDGQWMPDPRARENVPNQHGTLNSVVEVRA